MKNRRIFNRKLNNVGGHAPDGCACAAVYLAGNARVVGGAGGAQHARVGGHRARGAGAALGG